MAGETIVNREFPYRKALVTGGAGFIGSHIIEALLGLGVEVVSIDNYVAGKPENLARLKGRELLHEVDCDVADVNALRPHFEGVDIVFHQAASKKTICLNDPRRDLEVNARGAFNVLELSRDFGEKKVPPSLVKISIRGSEVNAEVVKQVLTGFLGLSNRSKKLTEE